MIDPFMVAYRILVAEEKLPPSVAEWLLSRTIPPELSKRMEIFMEKSDAGEMTPEERAESLAYCEAVQFITLLKTHAKVAKVVKGQRTGKVARKPEAFAA